eukprot:5111650-Amphidinium_carterae.1
MDQCWASFWAIVNKRAVSTLPVYGLDHVKEEFDVMCTQRKKVEEELEEMFLHLHVSSLERMLAWQSADEEGVAFSAL